MPKGQFSALFKGREVHGGYTPCIRLLESHVTLSGADFETQIRALTVTSDLVWNGYTGFSF